MRKIIVSEFVTLDGVMEAPETWQFPYFSADVAEDTKNNILTTDAFLLGRVTYDIFAASWPNQTNNEFDIADKLNSSPKFVISNTLQKAGWNNSTVIKGDGVEEVAKLKQQDGGVMGITGSATLVQALLEANLVDELQLQVHPIVLGSGKRLFKEGLNIQALKLISSKVYSSGVVLLTYQPDKKEE